MVLESIKTKWCNEHTTFSMEKRTMVNSIEQLKETLNIKTIHTEWNDEFPDYMLKPTYNNTPIYDNICNLCNAIQENCPRAKITRKDMPKIGLLAEMNNLEMAYFVSDATNIELFFYPKSESTKEWMEIFKQHLTRRQFFNNVKSYKTLKQYNSIFEMSTYHQLTSPDTPLNYSKPNVIKLNNDYILVQYQNDVFSPTYKVIKPGIKFQQFRPTINYNNNSFDCITLEVDDKLFIGDSIKHLWDGIQKEQNNNIIQINHNKMIHTLNTEDATLTIEFVDKQNNNTSKHITTLEKFRKDNNTKIILDKTYKDKRIILLSNGYVWNVDEFKFINLKSIKELENLNLILFSMSSEEKGIILSLDENSIECVPSIVFEKFMLKL